MALYLKYRPQSLDELVGQEAVKKTLLSAFLNNKLSHAYLFVGPRGTGKTSTARILAKMVNCSGEQSKAPCNKCSSCLSITDGSNLDLIEIDAASNNSVEDIRTLRERVKLAPTAAAKKVYIIDEVHMLSNSAFNALLKTLEEPPAHVLFILATTEPQKIPQTILSRVQRLDFKLALQEDIKTALKKIIEAEKIEMEEEALCQLARLADGSFRDGEKMLDQLSSSSKKITLADLRQTLRSSQFESTFKLADLILSKEVSKAVTLLNQEIEAGASARELTVSLLELVRALMLIKSGLGAELVKENFGSDKYQNLTELAKGVEIYDLLSCLKKLQSSLEQLKYTPILSLPLEVAIVEFGKGLAAGEVQSAQKAESGQVSDTGEVKRVKIESRPSTQLDSPEVAKLLEKWTFILETVKPYNYSLEALLRSVKILSCGEGVVTIEVPYSFHQRILETPKSKDLLESVMSDVLEKTVRIAVVLGERPARIEDLANVEVAADDEIIRLAAEIFNGKLVD